MANNENYQVVARRYRPKSFADLVGQSQVATALGNAIDQNRVGHAYLFTGARGVGKTSSARIFAKCLNCSAGPSIEPCGTCDICISVSTGDDIDVLEIDGASNRGIDEIRQLRANANIRPSRARYKIYIIDEVHMLTSPAFNALLKTLEEPPSHVKFIFCTTDPEKIPITVLSRCQRFDFPPIKTASIRDRLRLIVETEKIEADDAALELLARRAGGSMRDSQSLLEQLLSFSTGKITVNEVHSLLGTADNTLVFELATHIVESDSPACLAAIDRAVEGGIDAGQFTEQLLGLFRDAMALHVGCSSDLLLHTMIDDIERLRELTKKLGVESILAILQVLDQTLIKLRHNTYPRILLETAVVRCCHLPNLDLIPQLIEQLQAGGSVSIAANSNPSPAPTTSTETKKKAVSNDGKSELPKPILARQLTSSPSLVKPPKKTSCWNESNLAASWHELLSEFNDLTSEAAGNVDSIELAGDKLIVTLRSSYDLDICGRTEPRQRMEQALARVAGKALRLEFALMEKTATSLVPPPVMISARQRIRQMEQDDFVRSAIDLFDGEITSVHSPSGQG